MLYWSKVAYFYLKYCSTIDSKVDFIVQWDKLGILDSTHDFLQTFLHMNIIWLQEIFRESRVGNTHCDTWKSRKFLIPLFFTNFPSNQSFSANWFDEKYFAWRQWISCFFYTTVYRIQNFTAIIFSQNYRESNFLLKSFTLNWFDEKICLVVNFSIFHTVYTVQ